jgi:hypothetical protein
VTKKLYTKSKIFFLDPYVVMVEYKDTTLDMALRLHQTAMRTANKCIHGTWGYTTISEELVQLAPDNKVKNSMSWLFGNDAMMVCRAYVCFKNEIDALQFRLSLNTSAHQVLMWPSNATFTIFEHTEVSDDETSDETE